MGYSQMHTGIRPVFVVTANSNPPEFFPELFTQNSISSWCGSTATATLLTSLLLTSLLLTSLLLTALLLTALLLTALLLTATLLTADVCWDDNETPATQINTHVSQAKVLGKNSWRDRTTALGVANLIGATLIIATLIIAALIVAALIVAALIVAAALTAAAADACAPWGQDI
jgi:hypothetical protein